MKITIVTAVLNGAATIRDTIQSVGSQNDPDLEHLVIDGGSTDGTLDILRQHEGQLRWVSGPDAGISDAFNKGIELATGEVIGIISADDTLWPDAVRHVRAAFLRDPEADVVFGDAVYFEPGGRRTRSRPELDFREVHRRSPLRHAAVFVHRRAYERWGGFDVALRLAMDYELILRFYRSGAKFVYIDRVLAGIRTGGISAQRYRATIDETRRISIRYGYPPARARVEAWSNMYRTVLKRTLERTGLTWFIDRYRFLSPRFGRLEEPRD